jgi:ribonuclease-3
MTKRRASFVRNENLLNFAKKLELDQYVRAGKSLKKVDAKILSDCLEALIGAVFLDLGFDKAKEFIFEKILPGIGSDSFNSDFDCKTQLQEYFQERKIAYDFVTTCQQGSSNDRIWEVTLFIEGQPTRFCAESRTLKSAQERVAEIYLRSVNEIG